MRTIKDFTDLDLPPIQRSFIDQYDGTLESISRFNKLPEVLNPCYSRHYVIDHIEEHINEDGITDIKAISTKYTTGYSEYNDPNMTDDMAKNADDLSQVVRKIILSNNPQKAKDCGVKTCRSGRSTAVIFNNGKPILFKGFKL